ncbi:MAG TPA: NHL repeat-containing protein [Pyrinomonadaceae bacterium]|nr:NHL repeat-containing protein [Pyrinomonadaceae bacterium]
MPVNKRRTVLRLTLVAAALMAAACGLALVVFFVLREVKPPPTPVGWRARVGTLAGDGSPGAEDGEPLRARFREPFGVAADEEGNVYVADAGEGNRVRKISPEGRVTTLAGGREGFADGAGAAASFDTPSALALDGEGNIYVADTGNNRVRKVTKDGQVSTVAGSGEAGYADGPAASAQFNAPVGVAVDGEGNVYVADTYNDRVRLVTKDGQVRTLAGAGRPGLADGDALTAALFDTPCAVAVDREGNVYVADTGNNRLRRLTKDGQVTTLHVAPQNAAAQEGPPVGEVSRPAGLAVTHDGFLYVTELDRGRVLQVAPDLTARVIAGRGSGFADGAGDAARFNQPAGLALTHDGALLVADTANYLVRKISPKTEDDNDGDSRAARAAQFALDSAAVLPRLRVEELGGGGSFPWPLDPQGVRHEVAATLGEVRGSYDTDDSRHHLHSGIDVFGVHGQTVRAVFEEKVSGPLPNWGFGGLNEGLRVGLISYVHLRVGRDERDEPLKGSPFEAVRDEAGRVARVRVRRGTRLRVGDPLGTINRMYHVHLNLGPPGAELNPLALPWAGFSDTVAPRIERDGVKLFDESGNLLKEKRAGRLFVPRGRVRIVVDAYDQVDGNQPRRRLGLYRLGYEVTRDDGSPAPGFEGPRVRIEFNRLPPDQEATKIAYADESGITVYGSAATRFLYEVTNTVRDGRAERGHWDASALPPGDYTLRILAADFHGNQAAAGHELPITVE